MKKMKTSLALILLVTIESYAQTIEIDNKTYEITMYENASDEKTYGWNIYDKEPLGATVKNINDPQQGKVIRVKGTALSNGFALGLKNDTNHILQWKMKSDEWGVFYIAIYTKKGLRYLTYSPRDFDKGIGKKQKYKIRLGVGKIMQDGEWHIYTRNIKDDLKKHEPNNEFIKIDSIKYRGSASFDNIQTLKLTDTTPLPALVKKGEIFIVGPSTVHIGPAWNSERTLSCESANNPENLLAGWGEKLNTYVDTKVHNFARLGSNPVTFQDDNSDDILGINQTWEATKTAMQTAPKGSFLLIQFGANSKSLLGVDPTKIKDRIKRAEEILKIEKEFKRRIEIFINSAKDFGVTPVLITSLDKHSNDNNDNTEGRYPFPKYIRELAATNDILLLDLMKKSNEEFSDVPNPVLLDRFGDCFHPEKPRVDDVHLSPNGADIVAGWIKELAKDKGELSKLFK